MSALDDYTLEASSLVLEDNFNFVERTNATQIIDLNNGSYSNGQIVFNLAQVSNSGKYLDFKNSYLLIPLTLALSTTTPAGTTGFNQTNIENCYAACLKSGTTSLIHSISVRYSNNEVVSVQPFRNIIVNDQLLRKSSGETERNFFQSMLYGKDSVQSIVNGGNGSSCGIGECNNRIVSATNTQFLTSTNVYGTQPNTGRLSRMQEMAYNDLQSQVGQSFYNNTSQPVQISYRPYVIQRTATLIQYGINALIRMDFLHDFFDKMPLVKNGTFDLVLNTNCVSSVSGTVNIAANGNASYSGVWSYTNANGQTCPISLSEVSTAGGTGLQYTTTAACTPQLTASLTIGNPTFSNTRIYPSLVTMSPQTEATYLSNPIRTVKYNDHFVFTGIPQTAPSVSVNQQITANMSRLRKLTLYGFTASVNSTYFPYTGFQSPWSSQPCTNALGFKVTNFNVQVSGQYVYPQNLNMDWEFFLLNSRPEGALNAGLDVALSSGLISQFDYSSGAYGTIEIPLDRKLESTDDTPKSVVVSFINSAPVTMQYIAVLTYEREFNTDISSGVIVL